MTYKTYLQMKTKIERDLDLESEDFIQADELREYFNDAINEAETTIHKLGRDSHYFKTKTTLTLTSGSEDVSNWPSNIYGNKIIEIVYNDGSTVFEIKPFRGLSKHTLLAEIENDAANETNPTYRYLLRNDTASAGMKCQLVPKAKETSTTNVTMWYIRNMQEMVDDTSICDLPESYNFIWSYVKWRCRDKEQHPGTPDALTEMEKQKLLMAETLGPMLEDDHSSEIEADYSHYDESV